MLVLFVVLSWIFLLWFLVGLCQAARFGDEQWIVPETAPPAQDANATTPAIQQGEPASDGVALAA